MQKMEFFTTQCFVTFFVAFIFMNGNLKVLDAQRVTSVVGTFIGTTRDMNLFGKQCK